MAAVRACLSNAIRNYPLDDQGDLIARITSGNEVNFRSASFELLLHETLHRCGFSMSVHPDPGTGTARRPDFLVTSPDGGNFLLEAVLAGTRDGSDAAAEAMKDTTIDLLDGAPHALFTVDVQHEGNPTTQPSARTLIRVTHEWLNSLDANALADRLSQLGLDAMPSMTWRHEAWEVTLRALPVSPERRGTTTRLVGAMRMGLRWINAWEPLRAAVSSKANRYGDITMPLVIAINSDSFDLDPIDEVQALFGEEQWVENLDYPERSGSRRVPNGAWQGPHGPQNKRSSAVWIFNDLTPYSLASRRSTIYLNPSANIPLLNCFDMFPTRYIEGTRLIDTDGRSLREIFDLPENWPE